MNLKSILFIHVFFAFISLNTFSLSLENDNTNDVVLLYNNHIFDPAGDDNDGLAEGGETIGMPVSIYNSGTEMANNVTAILTCTDPDITITDNSENYGGIISDGEVWSVEDFDFDIDIDCVEHDVTFVLNITSDEGTWSSPFLIHIYPANVAEVPFLLYNNHIFDPAGDDNDGLAEGGETIGMPVSIFNSGTGTANNVTAVLTCLDTDISITDNNESYGDIISDGEVWSAGDYDFDIDIDCVEHDVEFVLEITSDEGTWTSAFLIHIYPANATEVPFLLYNNHIFDPAGDDNDGLAEGGETIGMPVSIFNSGTGTANNVTAVLTCLDTDISITDNNESYGDIISDGEVWSVGDYDFEIDTDCIEHDVEFVLEITSDEGTWTSAFLVHIYPANATEVPFLLYNNHIFDPAGEDNDGLAEGGESIGMPISIFNSGTGMANNVTAVLNCNDPDIIITDSIENFGGIISDGEVWSVGDYDFDIDIDCVEHDVEFMLEITSDEGTWTSPFLVHIYPANVVELPILLYNNHFFDPAGEDNDGLAEGGEFIEMPLSIFNSGTATATNVSAKLRCLDPDIIISDSSENFEDIVSDGEIWSNGDFGFDIDPNCIEHDVEFILEITSDEGVWVSPFLVHVFPANVVNSPILIYNNHDFNPAGDDNDGLAEGGESIGLLVSVFNSGIDTATDISAIIRCTDPDIIITDSTTSYEDIPADGEVWSNGHFNFDIAADCIEHDVTFVLELTSDEGTWTSPFLVHIFPANENVLPFLLYNTHIFNPAGNDNDNFPEGGESIGMSVSIFNSGTDTARNISAIIRCIDSDIIITDSTTSYEDLPSDSGIWSVGNFDFDINHDCIERDVEFIIEIISDEGNWSSPFLIRIYPANPDELPILIYNDHIFAPAGDDDDGLAEGGETIGMPVSIFNSGIATATNVTAILSCNDPDINITDASEYYNDIASDSEEFSISDFDFIISSDCTEHDVEFILHITSDEGTWLSPFLVHIYSNASAISEFSHSVNIAYPNPSNGVFKLLSTDMIGQINYQLLDASGSMIYNGEVFIGEGQEPVMKFDWLKSGIYFLKMNNDKQTRLQKLIIH